MQEFWLVGTVGCLKAVHLAQLRICCILSVGKYINRRERERERGGESLLLNMHLENTELQLIPLTEVQGHTIDDPDLKLEIRICFQLCDCNIGYKSIHNYCFKKSASLKE